MLTKLLASIRWQFYKRSKAYKRKQELAEMDRQWNTPAMREVRRKIRSR